MLAFVSTTHLHAALHQEHIEEEVFLSFRYMGGINTIVTAYVVDDQFYLPVTEFFSLLYINHSVDMQQMTVSGFYLDESVRYSIDFRDSKATVGTETFDFSRDSMLIKELDFYLTPDLFEDLFGLRFTMDINRLIIKLYSPETLPVVKRFQRRRERQSELHSSMQQSGNFPLRFPRKRALLNGAFVDYALYQQFSGAGNLSNYLLSFGGEFLNGDIQASLMGGQSRAGSSHSLGNARWRYVVLDNPYFSQFALGQHTSHNLFNQAYTGFSVSNEPIEPEVLYDNYTITGVTTADSEVELYRNNRLIDYTTADENGEYSFTFPLTYGSSQISLKIYRPTGEVEEVNRRIQIPFTFLPKGSVYYHVNAGRLDNLYKPWHLRRMRSNASVSVGATNWFTGTLGASYIQEENGEIPYFYSSLSARILTQYLVNLDLIPDAFYRITGSVVYPSSTSWRLALTHFTGQGLFNPVGLKQKLNANMFIPFWMFQVPFTAHTVLDAQRYADDAIWMRYRTQFSMKLRRLRLRLGYRGTVARHTTQTTFLDDYLTTSAMFTVPRKSYFPRILHNASLTAELEYSENFESLENLQVHFSKAVFRSGYFRLTYERNLLQDASMIEATFSLDLGKTRSTSTVRKVRNESAYAQNFRGTIGFDSQQNKVFFHDRQQVGRAASTIRLFVDENNSGAYDEGERLLNEQAVRILDAPMRAKNHKNGIRFMQLEPYRRYNLEINKSVIREPMLVPEFDQFAIRTDPNACKPVDVPFYLTGIIDGKVMRQSVQGLKPVAGLRVHLRSKDGKVEKTVKTFADGSFYAMEIPPGEYLMEIDENQLAFLGTDPYPKEQTFTVEPKAEGDMIDGLNFALVERGTEIIPPEVPPFLAGVEETQTSQNTNLPSTDSKPAPSGDYAGEDASVSTDAGVSGPEQVEEAPQLADAEELPRTESGARPGAATKTSDADRAEKPAGSESGQMAALQEAGTADTLKEGSQPGRERPRAGTIGIIQQPDIAGNTSPQSVPSEDIPTGAGADSLTPVPLEEFAATETPPAAASDAGKSGETAELPSPDTAIRQSPTEFSMESGDDEPGTASRPDIPVSPADQEALPIEPDSLPAVAATEEYDAMPPLTGEDVPGRTDSPAQPVIPVQLGESQTPEPIPESDTVFTSVELEEFARSESTLPPETTFGSQETTGSDGDQPSMAAGSGPSEDIPVAQTSDSLITVPLEEFAGVEPPAASPEAASGTADQVTGVQSTEAGAPASSSPVVPSAPSGSDLAEDIPAPEEGALAPVTLETFAQSDPLAQADSRPEDTPDQPAIPMDHEQPPAPEALPEESQAAAESPLEEFAVVMPPPAPGPTADTLPAPPEIPEPTPSEDLAEDLPDAVTDLPAVALEEYARVSPSEQVGEETTLAAPDRPNLTQTAGPGEEIPASVSVPSDFGALREFAQVDPLAGGDHWQGVSPEQPERPAGPEGQAMPGSSPGETTELAEVPVEEYPDETVRDTWPITPGFDSVLADGEEGSAAGVDTAGIPFFAVADFPEDEASLDDPDPGTPGKLDRETHSQGNDPAKGAVSQRLWTGIAISLILLILILIVVVRFLLKRRHR